MESMALYNQNFNILRTVRQDLFTNDGNMIMLLIFSLNCIGSWWGLSDGGYSGMHTMLVSHLGSAIHWYLLLFADFLQLITVLLLLITDFLLVTTPFLVVITGPARHFWAPDGGYSGIKRPGLQKWGYFLMSHMHSSLYTLLIPPLPSGLVKWCLPKA